METTGTHTERIAIRMHLCTSSKDDQTAFVVQQPALITSAFTVSILSDQSLNEGGLQFIYFMRSLT